MLYLYVLEAGIGDQVLYQCEIGNESFSTAKRAKDRMMKRIRAGRKLPNEFSFGGPGRPRTDNTFQPTWARVLAEGDQIIETWGNAPTALNLPLSRL